MPKSINLVGQKFGKLTVIGDSGQRKNNHVLWKCKCDCGNITYVVASSLKSGNTRSCGCIKFKNLTGQRFGRLTVIEKTDKRKNDSIMWKCKCDCGNITYVTTRHLTSGKTRSCGCIALKDLTGQRFSKLTVIEKTNMRKHGYVVWKCKCDCGNITYVDSSSLKSGNNKSCGCLKKKR